MTEAIAASLAEERLNCSKRWPNAWLTDGPNRKLSVPCAYWCARPRAGRFVKSRAVDQVDADTVAEERPHPRFVFVERGAGIAKLKDWIDALDARERPLILCGARELAVPRTGHAMTQRRWIVGHRTKRLDAGGTCLRCKVVATEPARLGDEERSNLCLSLPKLFWTRLMDRPAAATRSLWRLGSQVNSKRVKCWSLVRICPPIYRCHCVLDITQITRALYRPGAIEVSACWRPVVSSYRGSHAEVLGVALRQKSSQ